MDYYYSNGDKTVLVATFVFDGKKICWDTQCSANDLRAISLNGNKLREQVHHIISLPLLQSKLRSKTLPYFFEPIQPNSLEHFKKIPRNTMYFKFSTIKRHSTRPTARLLTA